MRDKFIGLKVDKSEKKTIEKLLTDIKRKTRYFHSEIIKKALQSYKASL